MDLEWKETEMEALNLADNALKGLKPDPAWDVSGVRDMAGGVIAVALVLCVGVIIIGCVSLIPGLVSNNQMERAFSWKRLLAAMLVPFVIGAAVSGWGWSCNVVRLQRVGREPFLHAGVRQWENQPEGRSRQGRRQSDRTGQTVGRRHRVRYLRHGQDHRESAVDDALKGWNWVSGGDGKGNIFQKAGQGIKDARPAYGNG